MQDHLQYPYLSLEVLLHKLRTNDPSLTKCFFRSGAVENILPALRNNTTIQGISFHGSDFRDHAVMSEVGSVLSDHPSLIEVRIYELKEQDVGAFIAISVAIQRNERLSSLILESSFISREIQDHLQVLLEKNSLQALEFYDCSGHEELDLSKALEKNTSLTKLHFDCIPLADDTVRELSRFIREKNLEEIHLGIWAIDSPLQRHRVVSAAQQSKSLRHFGLQLGQGEVSVDLLEDVGNLPASLTSLRSLDLTECFLTNEMFVALTKGLLNEKCNVETLLLANSEIPEEAGISADALEGLLSRNDSKLKHLSVESNSLGYDAAAAIARALKTNRKLESLRLSGNSDIGPQGIASIADALITNRALKALYLDGTQMGDEGLGSIVEMLKKNSSLELLDGRGCFSEQGMNAVMNNLHLFKGLKVLEAYSTYSAPATMVTGFTNALEQGNSLLGDYNTSLQEFKFRMDNTANRARLDYLMELNRGGRRILKSENVPTSLWPLILARSSRSPDVLFFLLRERPMLCSAKNQSATGKRKRDDDGDSHKSKMRKVLDWVSTKVVGSSFVADAF